MTQLDRVSVITVVRTQKRQTGCLSPQSRVSAKTMDDGRSGRQWLESAIAYCHWRSGNAWRRLSTSAERWAPERGAYLDAERLLTDVLREPDEPNIIHALLPDLRAAAPVLAGEVEYRSWRRDVLARALIQENPSYSDFKLLSHLPRPKLARMLAETRLNAVVAARLTA